MDSPSPESFSDHVSLRSEYAVFCGPSATDASRDRIISTANAQDVLQRIGAHRGELEGPLVLANRTAAVSPNKRTGLVGPVHRHLGLVGRILSAQCYLRSPPYHNSCGHLPNLLIVEPSTVEPDGVLDFQKRD